MNRFRKKALLLFCLVAADCGLAFPDAALWWLASCGVASHAGARHSSEALTRQREMDDLQGQADCVCMVELSSV